jgi:hypothetical protein
VSNLSDLLPAGGGQNNTEFTASGAIAAGKPVILNSNGTVSQAGLDTTTISTNDFLAGSQGTANIHKWCRPSDCAWDSADTNKFLFCTGRNGYIKGIVGTVSNSGGSTSVSLGTPVSIVSSGVTSMLGMAADPNNAGKFVIVYGGASSTGMAVSVVFNGATGLTVGTPQQFDATISSGEGAGFYGKIAADPNVENQYMILWNEPSSVKYVKAIMMTLASGSGTTMTFGSAATVHTPSSGSSEINGPVVFASPKDSGIFVTVFRDPNNSGYGTARCLSVSGTTITSNTASVFMSYGESIGHTGCFNTDVSGQFLAITAGYGPSGNTSRQWQGYVGTVNTTTKAITFGSMVGIGSTGQTGMAPARVACAGGGSGKFLINHLTTTGSIGNADVMQTIGTISSGAVTFTTPNHTYTDEVNTSGGGIGVANDPNNFGRFISVWAEANDASTPQRAFVTEVAGTYEKTNLTATNLLGVAPAAISNSASGTINTWGSLVSDLPRDPASSSAGTPVVYESANADHTRAVFDSDSNKVVIVYRDGGNSEHGTAVVGTVSGTSISYGTPVVFEAAEAAHFGIAFDSNSNKVVISFRDAGNSNYGTAIVGTVDGTSISFGSPVVFSSANSYYMGATFDSSNNKVVIVYSTGTMKAIVGTVSNTSISFGTAVQFDSGSTAKAAAATFDSNAGKVVIAWQDSGDGSKGHAIVGTVSSTAISFGNEVTFENADIYYPAATFDSNSNKVVLAYNDAQNSYYGTAIVGTVSGTDISFGTAVVFDESWDDWFSAAFDSSTNKAVIAYKDGGNSNYGTVIEGTVSNTSISFDTAVVFETSSIKETATVFDSNSNKVVIAYEDVGNSSYGTGVVFSPKGPLLTTASDYYVQENGTMTTTSTSPAQLIGKAISTTQINIKDYTG